MAKKSIKSLKDKINNSVSKMDSLKEKIHNSTKPVITNNKITEGKNIMRVFKNSQKKPIIIRSDDHKYKSLIMFTSSDHFKIMHNSTVIADSELYNGIIEIKEGLLYIRNKKYDMKNITFE